jgi:hypothetical protein
MLGKLMESKIPTFGMPENERSFDEYLGRYVILFNSSGNFIRSGRLVHIDEVMTLCPFDSIEYLPTPRRGWNNGNFKVKSEDVSAIAPTTKKSIEGFIRYSNEKDFDIQKK